MRKPLATTLCAAGLLTRRAARARSRNGVWPYQPLSLIAAWFLAATAGPAIAVDQAPPATVNLKSEISDLKSEIPNLKSDAPKVRELYVPFEDLNVLLESGPQRVLLPRAQYEELLARAKKTADARAPVGALLAAADYTVTVGQERAELAATLVVNVLEDGLHAVGLDVAGVGLRTAALDGKGASLGLADDGRLTLFVEGKGVHKLALEMVAPLVTTAATQVLNFRLPSPPAARMTLTVPGDVEVKSGAPVVGRVFDEKAGQTRIDLLPPRGDASIVLTLNSRLRRRDRIIVARSVLVDEVTGAYERLHATVSLAVLHRATDRFRFAVPAGFEVTDVASPLLARWAITTEGARKVLEVQLREETTDICRLTLSAYRTAPPLAAWTLPRLEPLDVVGHVAVVGLVVEDRLKAEAVEPEGLIPIDTSVLAQALPATVLAPEAGSVRIRPVVAYYAPQGQFGLAARFVQPPAKVLATTNLLLILEDGGLQVRGGFALVPEEEKLFALDFSVPVGWDVTAVTGPSGEALAFERYAVAGQAGRVHVRFPEGVPAGQERRVFFHAVRVPPDWFADWKGAPVAVEFPVFAAAGVARDIGALAVDARDDLTVRPEALDRLTPLDENEKAKFGLGGAAAALAYRYEGQPYQARLAVERTPPRVTAQTFSFFRVQRDAMAAHYELVYEVAEARTRVLSFVLPKDTPAALSVKGLDGVTLKEYTSEVVGQGPAERRRWTAVLADSRKGRVRLAVDFEQRLAEKEAAALALPVVAADGVAYQSGRVAVEGSAELQVQVTAHPRRIDIGELVDAEYQPGRRLLGAFGFVGDPPPVKVSVARELPYDLPRTIVQRAELATVLSAEGLAQSAARFLLKTKALFLEVQLPQGSTLWSATLDSKPAKPQREGDRLLVSLPSGADAAVHDLQVVYETPARGLGLWTRQDLFAPRLSVHADAAAPGQEVPVADLQWRLHLPTGYRVVRSEGSVVTDEVETPQLALSSLAGNLWDAGGGVGLDRSVVALGLMLFRATLIQEVGGRRGVGQVEYFMREDRDRDAAPAAPAPPPAAAQPTVGPNGEVLVPLDIKLPRALFEGTPKGIRPTTAAPVAGPAPAPASVTAEPPPVPPGEKPPEGKPAPARKLAEKQKAAWALEGVSSLRIDLQQTGAAVTFRSLGAEPRLGLTVAAEDRLDAMAWGLALAVLLVGLVLTGQPASRKAGYVVAVGVVATLVPVITGRIELAMVVNGTFYAACLLIPYYLAAAVARRFIEKVRGLFSPRTAAAGAAALLVIAAVLLAAGAAGAPAVAAGPAAAPASAAEPPPAAGPAMPPYVIQLAPPPVPVKVPADALLLPYDPASGTGIPSADRLLVPYEKYVELWNLAYPDQPIGTRPPPAPYGLAGAAFTAVLKGDEYLLFEGYIDIDVYTDEYAAVPLPLEGGVLAKADLDGKPARLSVVQGAAPSRDSKMPAPAQDNRVLPPAAQAPAARSAPPQAFIVLYASGKGRHRLDLAVRMKLEKRGGWRVAEGRLPAAPATGLTLRVPAPQTEVRLGGVLDRRSYETQAADETIQTAVGAGGTLSVQWRPKVGEGQMDQTLTADSRADLQVQEDQLRVRWALTLEFRHGEREFFSVLLPPGYLVEKVEGTNVRGWEVKDAAAEAPGKPARQALEVSLLKRTKGTEQFAVTLWRPGPVGAGALAEFDVPVVEVPGAMRHTGLVVIRRSPMLDVRTASAAGVTRTDLPAEKTRDGKPAADESPLGIRPYQAYQFVAVPFAVRLAAAPVAARTSAAVQTLVRMAERERRLESRIAITSQDRPLYRARFVVPADLKLDRVRAPGAFEWALTDEAGRKVLTVYLGAGVAGETAVVIEGKLGQDGPALAMDLPRLEVLDVERQQGDIVVQVDPAFEVRPEGLKNLEPLVLARVFAWLAAGQRNLAQLALHYTTPDHGGRLALAARKPDVSCYTVTNSRVTDRAIEDAVLLDWTIKNAGLREVAFLLPGWMKDARVSVPLLRQKTVTAVGAEAGAPVRVRLELQDEVMDDLRVLVEFDRLLTGAAHEAPIPTVETGRTDRRYVALESAGRDEVLVETSNGLEPLSRQQKEWAAVAGMLRGGQTSAFLVTAGAEAPRLAFRTREREAVETAGARIGLAQTVLVLDENGAYRAQQTYRMDNRTEQFLEIQLPPGASLWTAVVAGEPVKPTVLDDETRPRHVRVPLVKTAAGDLDYAVVLKYGGRMEALESLRLSVAFPIIRTVKINAELSQVELYLPEKYVWFDFRGSTRRVTEEGEFEAGILAYQNKVAESLVQTLRFGNPFAQARAALNLKSFSQEMQKSQQDFSGYQYNKDVQKEAAAAQVLLESADKEIQGQAQAGAQVMLNNDALRDAFANQRNVRARNLVKALDDNWGEAAVAAPKTPPAAEGTERFNAAWLSSNRLESVQVEGEKGGKKADAKDAGRGRLDLSGTEEHRAKQAADAPAQMQATQSNLMKVLQSQAGGGQPRGGQAVQAGEMVQHDRQTAQQQPADMLQRRSTDEDIVQRYQQKLQKREEQELQASTGTPLTLRGANTYTGGRVISGFEGLSTGGRGFAVGGGAAAAPVTGLASLEVALPLRGQQYRFTTPRGVVEIYGRAASAPLIEGLQRLGGVAVLVVILLVIRRFVRWQAFSVQAQGTLATVLIVLGVLGLLAGVLPVVGFLAMVVGVGMKVRLFFTRRRAAPAA
jgi:hypothetical protein